jgi:hypothetical protein
MSNERAEQQLPAVEQLRHALGANLLRAVRANPRARTGLSRRQRVGVLAAIGVAVVPGGMALASTFGSGPVEYECPSAAPPPDVEFRVGVPVDSAPAAEVEPAGTWPPNPCD